MSGWFFSWFGPGLDAFVVPTPSPPPVPITSVAPTASDPSTFDALAESTDRLCEQFRSDDGDVEDAPPPIILPHLEP